MSDDEPLAAMNYVAAKYGGLPSILVDLYGVQPVDQSPGEEGITMTGPMTDPMDLADERGWFAIAIQWANEPAWAGIQVGEPPDDRFYEGHGETLDDAVSAAYSLAVTAEGCG